MLNQQDRRKDRDRRKYCYTFHLPERRRGKDRRDGTDRRKSDRTPPVH